MPENTEKSITLTKEEIRKVSAERVDTIANEFKEGFQFLENSPKSVTFFGGSQTDPENIYYKTAYNLATLIVKELGYSVLSGGGPGIMEAANKGALESQGESLGLLIELKNPQIVNNYLTKNINFHYFFTRKVCLSFSAEAFIFFPGGFGTLDEFFELLTLIQTEKIEGVPLICVGSEYWNKLKDFIDSEMLARGYIDPKDNSLFTITDDLDEVVNIIKKVPVRNGLPLEKDR